MDVRASSWEEFRGEAKRLGFRSATAAMEDAMRLWLWWQRRQRSGPENDARSMQKATSGLPDWLVDLPHEGKDQ